MRTIPGRSVLFYAEEVWFLFALAMAWLMTGTAWAQTLARRPPRFEEYRATEIFKGQPAAPVLTTSEQRMFRTRIREGVRNGRGVWTMWPGFARQKKHTISIVRDREKKQIVLEVEE